MNQFDYEQEGRALTMKALSILEKPAEIQKDDPFTLNASLVTELIILRSVFEYKNGRGIKFQPDYLHQVFRESNEIYGYKGLRIKIYVTAIRLIPYVTYIFEEVCEDADDLEEGFQKLYEGGYLKDEARFLELLEEEQKQQPIGEPMVSYEKHGRKYDVYQSTITTNSFVEYKPYLQAFLLLLIDGAQYPCDSPYWVYFTLYETDEQKDKCFVGLGTLYAFYLSAGVSRHRISQMLLLPNYQRKGHGGELLLAMYKYSQSDELCKQITVEDPSEDFQVMRDITDARLLINEFRDIKATKEIDNLDQLRVLVLSKETLRTLMRKTKLYSQQIKRVHQILLYALINRKNRTVMSKFGSLVTDNLKSQMKPYQRMKNPLVIFERGETLNSQQMHFLEQSERMQRASLNYQELLSEELCFYQVIKDKLIKEKVV